MLTGRRSSCHVQATSLPSRRHDRKHLRVRPSSPFSSARSHITDINNLWLYSYCPGGPDSDFEYSTQSYTGYEPTSMRAIRARYDPYEQAKGRVEQLRSLGHSVEKVKSLVVLCTRVRSCLANKSIRSRSKLCSFRFPQL